MKEYVTYSLRKACCLTFGNNKSKDKIEDRKPRKPFC